MEQFTVPIIVIIGVIFTIYGGWCIWLTLKYFDNRESIALNNLNDTKVSGQITDLKDDVKVLKTELKNEFNQKFEKLEDHMADQFDKVFEKIDQIRK